MTERRLPTLVVVGLVVVGLVVGGIGLGACGGGGGGSVATFCRLIKTDRKKFADAGNSAAAIAALREVVAGAPGAVKKDMKTLVDALETETSGRTPTSSDLKTLNSASFRFQGYVHDKCKIDLIKSA